MLLVFGTVLKYIRLDRVRAPVQDTLTEHAPIFAHGYDSEIGGHGALQAVAAARFCPKVALVSKTGDGYEAAYILPNLRQEGVITSAVARSETIQTGCQIDFYDGPNLRQSILALSACGQISHNQIHEDILSDKTLLLLQNEISPSENSALLDKAKKKGARTVFNLSPHLNIDDQDLENIDFLIVSQKSAENLTNPKILNHKGLILFHEDGGSTARLPDGNIVETPVPAMDIIDKAGMEDAFCGTLAAAIYNGMELGAALKRAGLAAALTGMKKGAYRALPQRGDIEVALKNYPA